MIAMTAGLRTGVRKILIVFIMLAGGAGHAAADPNFFFGISATNLRYPDLPQFSCGNLSSIEQTNVVCSLTGLPVSATGTGCRRDVVQPGTFFSCPLGAGSVPPGTYAITITGTADGIAAETTGGTLTAPADPEMTLTLDPRNPAPGEPFTFRGTVYSGAGTPTGTVRGGLGVRSVQVLLSTVTLDASGNFSGTASLPAGSWTFRAEYDGDASFYSRALKISMDITTGSTPSTTVLTALPSSAGVGQPVTLTATVSPAAVTGSVSFTDGGTVLCAGAAVTNGVATCTTTFATGGTHALNAKYFGNATYAASNGTLSFVAGQQSQTITFNKPADTIFGAGNVTLAASASSALAVSFASTTTGVCTTGGTNGATVTLVGAGTCSITASQAGAATWQAAPDVVQSFAVAKAAQAITFTSTPPSPAFAGATYTIAATGGASGNPVVFALDAASTAGACTISGSTVSLTGTGTCLVNATQAGNANYEIATPKQQAIAVGKAAQTITFNKPADVALVAGSVALNASATSSLAVTFASTTPSVCTVSGATATLVAAGTCTITASQPGDANWAAAAAVTQSFNVNKATQAITFPRPADIAYAPGATVALVATASSGLPVAYASLTTAVCAVSGATATFAAAGICSIKASQSGNANYAAASDVTVSFGALAAPHITTTASVSPLSFSRPGVTLTFTFTLTNTGGLAATGLSLRDARLGAISCASPTIAPSGGTVTCSGTTVTTAADLSARRLSVSPQATYSYTLPSAAVSAASAMRSAAASAAPAVTTVTVALDVTAVASVDVAAVQTATQSAIRSLMSQRANVLTTSGPDTSRANARLAGGTLFGGVDDSQSQPVANFSRPSLLGGQGHFGATAPIAPFGQDTADMPAAMLGSSGMSGAPGAFRGVLQNFAGLRAGSELSSFDRDTAGGGNSIWQAPGMWRDYPDAQASRPTAPSGYRFSGNAEDGAGRFAFATSLSQWRAAMAAEDQAKRSSLGGIVTSSSGAPVANNATASDGLAGSYIPGTAASPSIARGALPPSPIDAWAEATASYITGSRLDGRRNGHAVVAHAGVDMIVMPGLLVGVMGTYDSFATDVASIAQSQKGDGWMAGPYLSARLTHNVYFDARASWGRASNHVDPLGGWVDQFSTTRSLASAKLTGVWTHGDWQFRPSAEVVWFSETAKEYVNALGITIPGQTFSVGRTLFGPEIGYHIVLPDKAVLEPFFGIKGVWDFARTEETTAAGDPIDAKGIHAQIEAGASLRTPAGITLRATGGYDGLGAASGYRAVQGQARVTLPLQ